MLFRSKALAELDLKFVLAFDPSRMRVCVTSIVSKWYESRPAVAERAGTANPPTVSRLRDHPGVAMRSVFAFALLSACSLPAVAQTAGSMLLQAGVINAVTLDDSTPLHTTVKPGLGALKIGRASCRERVCQYV